jgi:hypothetical protein
VNDFTASNGATVTLRDYRHFDAVSVGTADKTYDLAGVHTQALREYFAAEADNRSGRWRWPENPDLVVYPSDNPRYVRVLHEPTGQMMSYERDEYPDHTTGFSGAGNAYFAAHSKSKAWHEAKPGEVWTILDASAERIVFAHEDATVGGLAFVTSKGLYIPLDAPKIVSARLLWPMEVPS